MGELVLIERDDDSPIATVVLNRPERRNALVGPLARELGDELESIAADESVSVVVIRGAGNAFCSGLDLKEFGADPQPDWVAEFPELWRRVHHALFNMPAVVVGALQRAAVNGGAALALACDFVIAGEESFLQVGEVQQGMAAPMNVAWLRLRHPEALAARVALIGDRLYGPELVELGLAFEAVGEEAVLARTAELAGQLAANDASGIRRIKAAIRGTGFTGSADEWFAQPLEADPLNGRRMRPVAAVDR